GHPFGQREGCADRDRKGDDHREERGLDGPQDERPGAVGGPCWYGDAMDMAHRRRVGLAGVPTRASEEPEPVDDDGGPGLDREHGHREDEGGEGEDDRHPGRVTPDARFRVAQWRGDAPVSLGAPHHLCHEFRRSTWWPADDGHYWIEEICFSDCFTTVADSGWKLTWAR